MGKVRRLRQKYHASLVKNAESSVSSYAPQGIQDVPKLVVPQVQGGAACDSQQSNRDNMFAGLQIEFKPLDKEPKGTAMESDSMSVVSSGQDIQKGTKVDKRKKRREHLLKKIDVIRAGQRAEKDRKKREKTIITGDMHPLLNALPSLQELVASKSKEQSRMSKKLRGTPKQKKVKEEILSDIQMFTSIHQDPHFSKDPFKAVALALENRVLREDD